MTVEGGSPILVAQKVSRSFGGFLAVRDVSLEVSRGEIVGLIGPNGAGKTTLFNVLSCFLRSDGGEIWFDGQRIDGLPPYVPARLGLIRTFQISRMFSRMTVLENLMVATPNHHGDRLFSLFARPGTVRRREAEIRDKAEELIEYFKLGQLRDEYAGALSGGQRKLLELARAMMTDPLMMLLDEPMAGVNPALKEDLLSFIMDLREKGINFLVVEHDIDMIMRISDRILVMAEGRIIAEGKPVEIRSSAAVIDAYLGRAL